MRFKKAAAIVLAVSLASSAVSCKRYDDEKDAEDLKDLTESFIEALAADDGDAAEELTSRFDYGRSVEEEFLSDTRSIVIHSLQYMELTDFGDVEFDRDRGRAETMAEIEYVDLYDFMQSLDSVYLTEDDYIEALDSFGDRRSDEVHLEFIYDEETEEWLMTKNSARRITNLYLSRMIYIFSPVYMSSSDAFEYAVNALPAVAEGAYELMDYDIDRLRHYDNIIERGEGPLTEAAFNRFLYAYINYVLDHDIQYVENGYSDITLIGSAPSGDELYDVLLSDEFITVYYVDQLRESVLAVDPAESRDIMSAEMYDMLTEAIPDVSPEEYSLDVRYNSNGYFDYDVRFTSDIILDPGRGIFEATHQVDWEQFERCILEAARILHDSGEITQEQYDDFVENLTPDVYGFTYEGGESGSGHPNQALAIYESVPEWCEDGSIVYGYSNIDANGFWMFYSKDPECLGSVGYCVGDGGVWISNVFLPEFDQGTELIVDWWIDGDLIVDTQYITIERDHTHEVEVFLPLDDIPEECEIEMRLWEDNHSHVLSYVTLTRDS